MKATNHRRQRFPTRLNRERLAELEAEWEAERKAAEDAELFARMRDGSDPDHPLRKAEERLRRARLRRIYR